MSQVKTQGMVISTPAHEGLITTENAIVVVNNWAQYRK